MTRRGVADRDGVVGEVSGHDRARADHDVLADARAAEDERAVAQPRPRADAYRPRRGELPADGLDRVGVPVVGVGDVHGMARPHVVADLDALLADDAAPLPDHTAVADRDDGPLSTCSGDTPAESVAFGPMMHPSPSSIDDSPNNAPTGKQIALRWPKRANRCARR